MKKQEAKSGSEGESEPRQLRMSTRLRSRRREEVRVCREGVSARMRWIRSVFSCETSYPCTL